MKTGICGLILVESDVLAEGAITVAYSYIWAEVTYPVYRQGTIGKAKEHLEETAQLLDKQLKKIKGKALVAVNKAVVTQSSSAIPVVPLYIAALFKVMKEKVFMKGVLNRYVDYFQIDYIQITYSLMIKEEKE